MEVNVFPKFFSKNGQIKYTFKCHCTNLRNTFACPIVDFFKNNEKGMQFHSNIVMILCQSETEMLFQKIKKKNHKCCVFDRWEIFCVSYSTRK